MYTLFVRLSFHSIFFYFGGMEGGMGCISRGEDREEGRKVGVNYVRMDGGES